MKVEIRDRDLTSIIPPLDLDFEVDRYSKAAIGGCKQATINVKGYDPELWNLITLVRSPIKIYSDKGDAVWWGYIADIEATVLPIIGDQKTRVKAGISVDSMSNAIALAYAQVSLTDGSKSRQTTDYFVDTLGTAEYGTKQLLWSPGAATSAHATAAGTAHLYQTRYPQPVISAAPNANESGAVITARGWWDTLEWKYYANTGTAAVDTMTQCGSIVVTSGQFFANLYQDGTAGISLRETRDGDNTALYYVNQLLETGTINYRRILAEVDQFRNVRIYEEPAYQGNPYRLLADGSFEDKWGQPLRNELCPVAFWAARVDTFFNPNTSLLANPSLVFVEEMEYSMRDDKLTHRARGDPDPWEFPVVGYG